MNRTRVTNGVGGGEGSAKDLYHCVLMSSGTCVQ